MGVVLLNGFNVQVFLNSVIVSLKTLIWQARIKKIMQADEDVGKIALAVPVLVCE